ncbi:major facilitator superfamily domain-containing protein [Lipomyces oligophaga]|uniref:major facilitator superfamily domain-containing protein n=1 Tax=Lipomyces oligophaga TaxID=45792 RepID=UPI0034CE3FD5
MADEFDDVVLPPPGSPERIKLENRMKWKLDLTILPIIVGMFILNYLDRNNIAAAKLGTLLEDLNLSSTQYSTCVSILFVSYIILQIPSNLILSSIPRPNIYLPAVMICWGVISTSVGAAKTYGAMVGLRVLIGIFEAGFYPGVIYYLSCWYTSKELAKRSAIFVLGSYLSGAFSGLISYAVLENMDGVHGRAAWRWLFIIEGVATIGFSILAMPILPSLPQNTKWLSKQERLLGVVRLLEDIQLASEPGMSRENTIDTLATLSEWQKLRMGFKDAVTDDKVIMFFCTMFCVCGTASINTVFPTIVESLGYARAETLLLTAPPWILCAITCFLNAAHSDKTGERFWHMVWGPVLSMVGFIIGISTTKIAPRYVSIMILLQNYNAWGVGFAWITSTINQPAPKRAAAIAIINIGFNIPNIFMPYLYTSGMSPHFYAGFGVCICFAFVSVLGMILIRGKLIRLNKRLERGEVVDGMDGATGYRFIY